MELSHAQKYTIQIITILNDVFIRNLPLISIQSICMIGWNMYDPITLIAFCFSLNSLVIGSLTLISRCISTKCRFNYYYMEYVISYNIFLKSNRIQRHHFYCHQLFAECLAHSLEISSGRVETISIKPIYNGISFNVEILIENDANIIYKIIDDIQNNSDDAQNKLKTVKSVFIFFMLLFYKT